MDQFEMIKKGSIPNERWQFEVFLAPGLANLHAAKLPALAIVRDLVHAQLADHACYANPLRQHHIYLPKMAQDLFRLEPLA